MHTNYDKARTANICNPQAYKDKAGVIPGSAPFTYTSPAYLSTNLVEVDSVLCYIVETS